MSILLLFVVCFIFLACIRIPVPFAAGISGIIGMIVVGLPMNVIPGALFNGLNSFVFLALPAFIFAGDIMSLGGITKSIVRMVRACFGRIKGSVGATTVIASALFGTISGSSVATVSAIGSMMLPEMLKAGYDRKYATSLIAASGFLGILIPPSIPGVVFAISAGLPVGDVWLSTLVPGVLLTISYVVYNRIFHAKDETSEAGNIDIKEYLGELKRTTPRGLVALTMPLIIFGGVYSGVMTATEAGAVAVIYGLVVGWIIHPLVFGDAREKGLIELSRRSLVTSAAICLTISFAAIPSALFTYAQCAQEITQWLGSITQSRTIFLLLMNLALLIVGMFMETNTAILLLSPILLPVAESFGVHPVHFAAIMLLNLEIGMITPPLAANVFVSCKISGLTMDKVLKPMMSLIAICIPILLLTTYIPALSMIFLHAAR